MTYQIRPARRSEAKPLIGLFSESGAGKTLSALYLAKGFVGPSGRIGMIETEAGRGEAYADMINYLVVPMRETFSPRNYGEALTVCEQSSLDALIIDSCSHEWEGAGGVLDMAAQNQADGKSGQLVWQKPKMDHQRHFMLRILATPIPLVILCMRAKYPMEQTIVGNKKEWARSTKLEPKQSEDILFEMFVHGWIGQEDHKFNGTKYTRPELRQILKSGEMISVETGAALAAWAKETGAGASFTPFASAERAQVPPGSEPLCKDCSATKGEEVQRVFMPADQTRPQSVWACPNLIKDHPHVSHKRVLEKLANTQQGEAE